MDVNNGGVLPVARHVERDVEKSRDRPLAVAAGIVHQEGLDHVLGSDAADEGMRDLLRLAGWRGYRPKVAGSRRAVVV